MLIIPGKKKFWVPGLVSGGATVGGGGSSVVVDAIDTTENANNSGTSSYSGLTIGSGSNRALVAVLLFGGGNAGAASSISVTWNGVSLSQIIGPVSNGTVGDIYIYGMVNPASGNHNLVVTWAGSSVGLWTSLISFTGANQTGGTTTFANAVSNTGSGSVPTINATNGANQVAVAGFMSAANFTTTGAGTTSLGFNNVMSNWGTAANYSTGANPGLSFNPSGTTWAAATVSVH